MNIITIPGSEDNFRAFFTGLLNSEYNYNNRALIAGYLNSVDHTCKLTSILFNMYYRYTSTDTRVSLIRDLSIDYIITCLYEMYGPVDYDYVYDRFFNKINIGDYVLSGSLIMSQYTGKSSRNKHNCKLREISPGNNNTRYLLVEQILKYTIVQTTG